MSDCINCTTQTPLRMCAAKDPTCMHCDWCGWCGDPKTLQDRTPHEKRTPRRRALKPRRRALHLGARQENYGDVFVAQPDGFLCERCANEAELDLGDDAVEVWEVGGHGWLGPCVCKKCKLSIPVVIDGVESESEGGSRG